MEGICLAQEGFDSGKERKNNMEKRLLSIKEVSLYLNLSIQTIRNQLSAGTFPIPPIKLGGKLLWDKRKVDNFLNKAQAKY